MKSEPAKAAEEVLFRRNTPYKKPPKKNTGPKKGPPKYHNPFKGVRV